VAIEQGNKILPLGYRAPVEKQDQIEEK